MGRWWQSEWPGAETRSISCALSSSRRGPPNRTWSWTRMPWRDKCVHTQFTCSLTLQSEIHSAGRWFSLFVFLYYWKLSVFWVVLTCSLSVSLPAAEGAAESIGWHGGTVSLLSRSLPPGEQDPGSGRTATEGGKVQCNSRWHSRWRSFSHSVLLHKLNTSVFDLIGVNQG